MLGLGNSITDGAVLEDAFDLASISSLQIWLKKGEGITTDGGNVSNWTSQVGSYQFVQTVSEKQPVHDASTDAVQFTATRQLNITSDGSTPATFSTATNGPITVAAVFKANVDNTSTATKFQHIFSLNTAQRVQMFLEGDFFYLTGDGSQITINPGSTTVLVQDEIALITWTHPGSTGVAKLFKNTNTTPIGTKSGTPGTIQFNQMGEDNGVSSRGLTSGVIEMAVFNAELTGDDLSNALTDIATRAGI